VLLSKNHEKVLPGTSLFHPEASVNKPNQVKSTLLSLLFWNGLSGVSCFHCWRVIPLARIFGGECSPTTLVAVTTSYFSSPNFRQSLVLTLLVETGGLQGDLWSPSSKRHMVVSCPLMPLKRKQHSWLSPINTCFRQIVAKLVTLHSHWAQS